MKETQHFNQFSEIKLCSYHVAFGTWRPVNSSNTLKKDKSENTHIHLKLITKKAISEERVVKAMVRTGDPGGPGEPRGPSKPLGPYEE